MNTPGTVKRSDLQAWKMVAGNEDRYPIVIHEGVRKEWVAIGWIVIGPASDEDKATYPTVVED
jgi:hypothetical protein